jgi:DNA-3-methyladenine glycosylase I
MQLERCPWCGSDPLYVRYHDQEWGMPLHDDRRLFELLVLEGAQAGLNWLTILRKREGYRTAFDGFDPERIARYDATQVARLLADSGIVRNRLKIQATIRNARGYLAILEQHGGFDAFLWRYVDGQPRQNAWSTLVEVPARSPEAEAMSRDLKRLGFAFVGPTICYAFMQAVGMVNDHLVTCFRYRELSNPPG